MGGLKDGEISGKSVLDTGIAITLHLPGLDPLANASALVRVGDLQAEVK